MKTDSFSTYMKSFAFLSSGQHNLSCVVLTANGGPMLLAESGIPKSWLEFNLRKLPYFVLASSHIHSREVYHVENSPKYQSLFIHVILCDK